MYAMNRSIHSLFTTLKSIAKRVWRILRKWGHKLASTTWRKVIALILFGECLFYIRYKYMRYYIKHAPLLRRIVPASSKQRISEIRKYARQYQKYNRGARRQFLIDCFGCDLNEIKRGNIEQLISKIYFLRYDDSTRSTLPPKEVEWRDGLIASITEDIENEINHKFADGINTKLIDSTYDIGTRTLRTTHRPLMFYLFVHFGVKQMSNFTFRFIFGFKVQSIRGLKVWSKMTGHKTKINEFEPICYFGGACTGNPAQAVLLMYKLQRKYGNTRNLFVVEVPWTEMSILHFVPFSNRNYVTNKVALSMDQITEIFIDLERMMLHENGVINQPEDFRGRVQCQWNLIGESFGTLVCSAIYQRIKRQNLGIVPRLILVDAVSLCMTDRSAGLRRLQMVRDETWFKRMFQVILREEIMMATIGARYFHWYEYCLYPHELINNGCSKGHIIVSGTRDHVHPLESIRRGVKDANALCRDKEKCITHVVMEGILHGIWLVHPYYMDVVLDKL